MKLIVQPYGEKLGNLLTEDLCSGKYRSFIFSVAYAKISGVDALYDPIQTFCAAGGTVSATIGIDQKNTSYEALRAVLGFADPLFIFHNRSMSSTFHPKVYILAGEKHGKIYVGSNNLTNGGLYSNYEVASCEEFDLGVPESAETFANFVRSFNGFRQESECCKRASEELIKQLYDDHMICTESEIRLTSKKPGPTGAAAKGNAIFGTEPITGKTKKHDFSHLAPETQIRSEYRPVVASQGAEVPVPTTETEEVTGPAKSFYKHLSKNDVDLKSSPGQIIIPITFKSFFEPLSDPQRTPKGAMQSERYFNLRYENTNAIVENARVILYEPSPLHPRKNSEVRFAIRNREIFGTFEQGDVLVFTKVQQNTQGQFIYTVKHIPHDSPDAGAYPERFAWIVE